MATARIRTASPGGGPTWIPASPDEFAPGRIFLTRGWVLARRPGGDHLPLQLADAGRPAGSIAVSTEIRAGIFRRWEILAEPAIDGSVLGQATALEALIRLARLNRVDLLDSFSNMARWTDPELKGLLAKGEIEHFGTYVVDLTREMRRIRESMHSHHRRLLLKAEAAGVEVRDSVPPADFMRLMDETYGRGGRARPFDSRYLERIIVAPGFDRIISSAWLGGTLEAAIIVPHDARRGYFLHGASRTRATPGATVAAHFAAMGRLRAAGVGEYDLGGARRITKDARLAGIFRFKQHFGGSFEDCLRWRLPLTHLGRVGLTIARRLGRL